MALRDVNQPKKKRLLSAFEVAEIFSKILGKQVAVGRTVGGCYFLK